jgi:hypothetical protein
MSSIRLLAADDVLLRRIFGGMVDGTAGTRRIQFKNPFTNQVESREVPDVDVDLDLLYANSWQVGWDTRLIVLALGCSRAEAQAELEPMIEGDDWGLSRVSERATKALTSTPPEKLEGYDIKLEPGQKLFMFDGG